MKILVVEDDAKISDLLVRVLVEAGYAVDTETDGREALDAILEHTYDLIVLDRMLPGLNGLQICRKVRESEVESPILMLTALSSANNRVAGLDSGADDYLVKPFHLDELLARVRALLRRAPSPRQTIIRVADLSLNPATRLATRGGIQIRLTAREYALLEYLMRNEGKVVSESELLEHVWDTEYDGMSNVVPTYIRYVRKRISPNGETELIHTRRGQGYVLSEEGYVS